MDIESSSDFGDVMLKEISFSIQAIATIRQKMKEILEKSRTLTKAVIKELLDSCANFFEALELLLTCGDSLLKDIAKREMVSCRIIKSSWPVQSSLVDFYCTIKYGADFYYYVLLCRK